MSIGGTDSIYSGGATSGEVHPVDPPKNVRGAAPSHESGSSSSMGGIKGLTDQQFQDYLLLLAQGICTDSQKRNQASIKRQEERRKDEEARSSS